MTTGRRLIAGATLVVGAYWFAATNGYFGLAKAGLSRIYPAFLALWVIGIAMDWRGRRDHPIKEPSPAQSARNVILMTGGAAVIFTFRGAHASGNWAIPIVIAIATPCLAFAAFHVTSRYQGQIGEARFKTIPEEQ